MSDCRAHGWFLALQSALFRRLERLGLHVYLVELGDDDLSIAPPALPDGYVTRRVDHVELQQWAGRVSGLSPEFVHGAIERGDRCVGNFYCGELVGYGFISTSRAPVTTQLEIAVGDRLVYRYKGWTHPEHRRLHLSHSRGRLGRHLYPIPDGSRSVSYMAMHNLPSRLKHRDLRPVRLGCCGFIRLLGREYPFTGRVPRRFGFQLQRKGGKKRAPSAERPPR